MRRRGIPRRKRILFACEGESEQSYGTLLHRLVEHNRRLHIDAVIPPPGRGDPLAIIERSIRFLHARQSSRAPYLVRAVILDADKRGENPQRDRQIDALASRHDLHVIWQSPCHEAFLLRHVAGQQTLRPSTSKEAHDRLASVWKDYRKGSPTAFLLKYIGLDEIALACQVEQELQRFLQAISYFS